MPKTDTGECDRPEASEAVPPKPATWTTERKNQLREMWSRKLSSNAIAETLGGVTRNAVMGMVNRLGLHGRGGSRDTVPTMSETRRMFEEVYDEPFDPAGTGHLHGYVAIGAAMTDRDPERLARFLHIPQADVERALRDLSECGAWPEGEDVPEAWEHEGDGNMALVIDCMIAAGVLPRRTTH